MRVEEDETAVVKEKNESTLMMNHGGGGGLEGGWLNATDGIQGLRNDTARWTKRGTPWIYETSAKVRREYPIFPI